MASVQPSTPWVITTVSDDDEETVRAVSGVAADTANGSPLIGMVEAAMAQAITKKVNRKLWFGLWFGLSVFCLLPMLVMGVAWIFGGILSQFEGWSWSDGFFYVVR